MTSEDYNKLYAYINEILEKYNNDEFISKYNCYIDKEYEYSPEIQHKLVLHTKSANSVQFNDDDNITIFECDKPAYGYTMYHFGFIKFDYKSGMFVRTRKTPSGFRHSCDDEFDEDKINFAFIKKWVDYNISLIMKQPKLNEINQKIAEIKTDFVK